MPPVPGAADKPEIKPPSSNPSDQRTSVPRFRLESQPAERRPRNPAHVGPASHPRRVDRPTLVAFGLKEPPFGGRLAEELSVGTSQKGAARRVPWLDSHGSSCRSASERLPLLCPKLPDPTPPHGARRRAKSLHVNYYEQNSCRPQVKMSGLPQIEMSGSEYRSAMTLAYLTMSGRELDPARAWPMNHVTESFAITVQSSCA
jgi:hypothetical protein